MKKFFNVLQESPLFKGIEVNDLESVLNCLSAKEISYNKNAIISIAGDVIQNIGVVLTGQVQVVKDDSMGNRTIVASLSSSEIYGEAICCLGDEKSPVTVIASENSVILSLDFKRILKVCSNACDFHTKLIENMLFILASKNVFLQNRMEIVTNRSIRTKVKLYLESFVRTQGRHIFIPLNREQMAEYLCVDRSALSHELMKMKKDGLIDYHRNVFKLLK